MKIAAFFIFVFFCDSLFAEQKIFISSKLKGDDLHREILDWVKAKSEERKNYIEGIEIKENNYEVFDNGIIYMFFVSDGVMDKKSLCFDVNFHIEYDKFLVDFSNIRLLDVETKKTKKLKFTVWETLTNGGWFKEYNRNITEITEELENIINNPR